MRTVSEITSSNLSSALSTIETWGSTYVNVRSEGATGNGTTDDTSAFLKAIKKCQDKGRILYIPNGNYKLTQELYLTCGVQGEDQDGAQLWFYHGSGLRSIRIYADVIRPDRLSEPARSARAGIEPQGEFLTYVTCTTKAEAAQFVEGDFIHVAAGKNPFDADDHLYRYHVIWRVEKVDVSTGRVYINGVIDEALSDDGFSPTSDMYAPDPWVAGHAYAEGDITYGNAGSNNPNYRGFFKCVQAGTSVSGGVYNTIQDDVGVVGAPVWVRMCYDVGALYGTTKLDCRPFIQKVQTCTNKEIGNFTVSYKGSGDALLGIDAKAVAFTTFKNITFTGKYAIGMQVTEGVNFINMWNIKKFGRGVVGISMYRAFGLYSARNVDIDGFVTDAGSDTENTQPLIFLESFSKGITIRNCYFTRGKQFSGRCIFLTGGSEVKIYNNKMLGFDMPFRSNMNTVGLGDPAIFHDGKIVLCEGNDISISSKNFRYGGLFSPDNFWKDNHFEIGYNIATHPPLVKFDANQVESIELFFTPRAPGVGYYLDTAYTKLSQFDQKYADMVVLAAEVYYENAPVGAIADIRFFRKDKNGVSTKIFSDDGAVNRVVVTDEEPYAYMDTKDGTASALMLASLGEVFQIDQYNNSVCTTGTIHVRFICLVDRKYNKVNPVDLAYLV